MTLAPRRLLALRRHSCVGVWTGADVEIILQPRPGKTIPGSNLESSHNGSQFIARDFKEFVRISGLTHVRPSPYYPQIQRYDRTLATSRIKPIASAQGFPRAFQDAPRPVTAFVERYNAVRLPLVSCHRDFFQLTLNQSGVSYLLQATPDYFKQPQIQKKICNENSENP